MLRPTTEAELAEAIAGAAGPVRIQGGGTRPVGAVEGAGQSVESLSVAGLSGITLYEPGALTLVAQAGTPLAEVEAALAAENQRLAFEPMDHRALLGTEGAPTIGAVAAMNNSGPRRVQAGACRDSLIGVRFVDGMGQVIKNGGRVMKNVTGYDLVKLMAGAYGTLGVLSEVSFKVLPGVEAEASLVLRGLDVPQAVAAMSRALGSPYEVSGAAYVPGEVPETWLRLEGFDASVTYRAGRLRDELAGFGEVTMAEDSAASWARIRDVAPFVGCEGDLWRISVRPSDAPAVVERLAARQVMLDWGGGLIWAEVAHGADARAALAGIGGHATLVEAQTPAHPVFQPETGAVAMLSQGLRARFDPRGILNTGLMG